MTETVIPIPTPNGKARPTAIPATYQSLTDAEQSQMAQGALKSLEQKHFGIALELVANTALAEAQRKELRQQQADLMAGIRKLRSEYAALLETANDGVEG